ncbi:hypothetical protein EMCRGX_G023888 [Ephydatia muelleri]
MLIIEYRIPLPLTVEEYKIAQLYIIQKKSREEGEVQLITNKPYTDGPNGSGQYTDYIYYIDRHLPGWLRSLAPKTALEVHEESWNAYPYTKTKFSLPFVEKFQIHLETLFVADSGNQENVFNLKGAELNEREIVVMDMVTEQLTGHDYKQEEDPHLFRSQKTGRGPLMDDWRTKPPDRVIMCAYKLMKIEFPYWGLQSKVERLIDHALHQIMLRAHKQAWAWQDEWVGLTMDDIRALERDTQRILQEKLSHAPSPCEIDPHPKGAPGCHSSATPLGDHGSATPSDGIVKVLQLTKRTGARSKVLKGLVVMALFNDHSRAISNRSNIAPRNS